MHLLESQSFRMQVGLLMRGLHEAYTCEGFFLPNGGELDRVGLVQFLSGRANRPVTRGEGFESHKMLSGVVELLLSCTHIRDAHSFR